MEKTEELRKKHGKFIQNFPCLTLVIGLIFKFAGLSVFPVWKTIYLVVTLIIIGLVIVRKPSIGMLLYFTLYMLYMCAVNGTLALFYGVIGLLLFFSIDYHKNTLMLCSIVVLLCSTGSPVIIGLSIGAYALICVQRGYGSPSIFTLIIVVVSFTSHAFGTMPIFSAITQGGDIKELFLFKLQDVETFTGVVDVFKNNNTQILIVYFVFYITFRLLWEKENQDDSIAYEPKLNKTPIVVLLVSYSCVYSLVTVAMKSNIMISEYILLNVGLCLSFLMFYLAPFYPLSELLTFEQKRKLQEEKEMGQQVPFVEAKILQTYGWNSIAGYGDVKSELIDVLEPYTDNSVKKDMNTNNIDPVKGLLLFGAPGSGKTLFVKAIAAEAKLPIISVAGSEFLSKWVGESDMNLRNIFTQAKNKAPCIIFFDELESFLPLREKTNYTWEKQLVTTFLSQMDGFSKLKDVLVIGATNFPDQIDPAAIRPGRFDKCIYIKEPDLHAKIDLLKHYLGDTTKLPLEQLSEVAKQLERYTAADIEGLIKELYRRNRFTMISAEEIISASKMFKPSITLDMRDRYMKLEMQYNRSLIKNNTKETKQKKYSWNDIAGMENEKKQMKNLIEQPLKYADKYAEVELESPKGILMYGPPGCGKTLFAKVIASECSANFSVVNGPELLSGKTGESEEKLRHIFREAREQTPVIVFFDEFDAIAESRSNNHTGVKIINQLLTEMDGMEELNGVMILAATNRIEDIDPALRRTGRFDQVIYIDLPDCLSREVQFKFHLTTDQNLDFNQMAYASEHFTCADIKGCCKQIKERKLEYLIEGKQDCITQEECLRIIKGFHKTLSQSERLCYERQKIHGN